MARLKFATLFGAAVLAGAAIAAGPRPAALTKASPGMWEVEGLPGAKTPTRECVADVSALAQYEHRKQSCTLSVLSGDGESTLFQYNCPGGGFGRSKLTLITPRSLRIETQGISDGLPFNYTLQARRVGDCATKIPASAH